VPNVFGAHEVNRIFRNVLRVIANALEVPRNEDQVQVIDYAVWSFRDTGSEDVREVLVHLIDGDASAATAGQTGGVDEKDTLGFVAQFHVKPAVPLSSVASRKTHGSAGTFDIDLPLAGGPGVECRVGAGNANGDHTIVFTFATNLTRVGGASVTSGNGSVASSMVGSDPHQYIVNLTGVTDAQTITLSLTNVNDANGDFSALISLPMGFLLGDTNADRAVNAADATTTRNSSGLIANANNFRSDVNLDGTINAADATIVRGKSGDALPPAPVEARRHLEEAR
jgi:hypothetical protein